jgi:hypothetical protein
VAHIFLVITGCAIICYAVLVTGDTRFIEAFNLDTIINDTVPGLVGLVSLGMQPTYLNILPLYIVLLLMTPPMLLLVRKSPIGALAASGAVYLVTQLFRLNLPSYPEQGWWFLNPLAWQFLFVIGMVMGRAILDGRPIPRQPVLLRFSIAYLVVALIWTVSGFYPAWDLAPVPTFIWEFDKTSLFLPRLLHVLALVVVVMHLPLESWVRGGVWARPFIALGRHSLPVFCLGTALALAAQVVRALSGGAVLLDTGLAAQFALAGVLEWYRAGQQVNSRYVAAERSY